MADHKNLYIDQYSVYSDNYIVKENDGTVANLSGYTATGTVRKDYSSTSGTDMNANISAPASGRVDILLTAAQTASMKPGRYVYDVVIDNSNGNKIRIAEGILVVSPGVTR